MEVKGPIYMQQMCPVQYSYSMRGKHELYHADAMKKKKPAQLVTIAINVVFKSSLCGMQQH